MRCGISRFQGVETNCAIDDGKSLAGREPIFHPQWKGHLKGLDARSGGDTTTVISEKETALGPLHDFFLDLNIPTRAQFGEVRVYRRVYPGGRNPCPRGFSPPLCAAGPRPPGLARHPSAMPNWVFSVRRAFAPWNRLARERTPDTQGWGGSDDKVWAWTHDLMEVGSRSMEKADRFYLSPVGLTHYTGPWRDFHRVVTSGIGRPMACSTVLRRATGKAKNPSTSYLSDRWNGIPIGASFGWADFIRFDEYLQNQGNRAARPHAAATDPGDPPKPGG